MHVCKDHGGILFVHVWFARTRIPELDIETITQADTGHCYIGGLGSPSLLNLQVWLNITHFRVGLIPYFRADLILTSFDIIFQV